MENNVVKLPFFFAVIALVLHYIAGAPQEFSVQEIGPGYNTYGHQQMETARRRGIRPLIDTIREEEKYGNDGGHIRTISTTFIKVAESASSALSKSLGQPPENTVNLAEGFFPILENIGNRLGGLA